MRSKQLVLQRYNTDKIAHGYLDWYDANFAHLVDQDIKLLEIGVRKGGSLLLWRDYFPKGTIVGVDVNVPVGFRGEERIQIFQGSQGDRGFLNEVAERAAPEGFDIIIDDASHIGRLAKRSFWLLFDKYLKPSGVYAIEDWGTGYWDDWPDGKAFQSVPPAPAKWMKILSKKSKAPDNLCFPNHNWGMVGFVKELVDEQGMSDLTRARSTSDPKRSSKFEKMVITPSIVFVTKKAS